MTTPDQTAAFLDHLPIGVWVAHAERGELAYANEAFVQIMGTAAKADVEAGGYSEPYGICDRSGNLYPDDQLPFPRVLASKREVTLDDIVIHRGDGRRVNIRAIGKPLFDANGEISHVIVTFGDITAEIRAREESAALEQRLSHAVEHAPIALFMIDNDGTITLSQGRGLRRLGVQSGELVGQSVFELYGDHPTIPGYLRRGLSGESVTYTVDVGDVTMETFLAPLEDLHGNRTGAIGISTDITERKLMQARAIQADRIAAMGTLAASVAHEINNPLTYMIANLATAAREIAALRSEITRLAASDGEAQKAHGRIDTLASLCSTAAEGAERIRVVTRSLKSFSRPEQEGLVAVDVEGAIRSVLQLASKQVLARARLSVDLAPVPKVAATETRLVQVFLNLLLNAEQAIEGGRPEDNEIALRTTTEGGYVVIDISDTGTGISNDARDRLFDPFFTTKDVGEGSGLGLFVCKNIVETLGGTISAHNREGGGARFRVRLPGIVEKA